MKPVSISEEQILPPSSQDRGHIPNIDFLSSIIKLEENPPDSKKNLALPETLNPQKTVKKSQLKHLSSNKKPKNEDLRYSRGMSWSQSHDPEGFYQLNKGMENFNNVINGEEAIKDNIVAIKSQKEKSLWRKIKNFMLNEGDLKRETELIVTINDLSSRSNYDLFIKKMKRIDKRYIRQLRFKNLKNKLLIQQWKEIELIIRDWPLNSLKFEGTRLEKEHCRTLLYFLRNNHNHIENLTFNYNGLTSETLQFLFRDMLKLSDLNKLKRLSIKNNPYIYQNLSFFQSFDEELKAKTKTSIGFLYKVDRELISKKFNFLSLDFSDNNLDDRKIKKIILGLQDNHSTNDIQAINLANNEKITENGWSLFTEKHLTTAMNLHSLNISHCNLDDNSFKRICEGITKNEALNLHTLDISDNVNISASGFLFFARKVLLRCLSLEILVMSNCGLNDFLIEGIVDGLLLTEENLEIISQRCNLSLSESVFLGDHKLGLKSLDLSQNWSVSDKGWLKLLMPLLSMASKLEHLKLRDCVLNEDKLKNIIELIGSLHLKSFDVSENASITEIIGWPLYSNSYLFKSNRIQSLNLAKSNINSEKFKVIYSGLSRNLNAFETLQELNLSYNLEIKEKDFGLIMKEFAIRFSKLRSLKLRKIGFSDEKIRNLIFELEKQEKPWFLNLRVLDISENPELTEIGFFSLTKGLLKHSLLLEELYFEAMDLNDKKITVLIGFLREEVQNSRLKSLKTLSFNGNSNCSEISFQDFGLFLKDFQDLILKNLSKALNIKFADCKVHNMKLLRFIEAFDQTKITLSSLDLSKNKDISNEGFKSLCEAMIADKLRISHLKLSDCVLNKWKLKDISFGAELESLDLSENLNISSNEFENLLSKSSKLKTLSLRKCCLKDSDLKVISQILYNNKLTSRFLAINFSSNMDISALGYKAFLLAFFAKEKALNVSAWALKNGNGLNIDMEASESISINKDIKNQRESMNTQLNDMKFKTVCNTLAIQKAEFQMKTLDLSKNRISSETFEEFVNKVLLHSKELETLILDNVVISNKKFAILIKFLENCPENVHNLSLKGSKDISPELWTRFFENIRKLTLKSLILDDCDLNDMRIEAFITGINGNVNSLDLNKTNINKSLNFLSLTNIKKVSDNQFRVFIDKFLCFFESLEELNLADCDLTDSKIKSLMILLTDKSKLAKIDLSGPNTISDCAFNDFLMNLRNLAGFKSLKLKNCRLSPGKITTLAETYESFLKKGGTYGLDLDIEENKAIPNHSFSILSMKTLQIKGLERLCLANCELEDNAITMMINSLLENKTISGLKELDLSRNPGIIEGFYLIFMHISVIFPELIALNLKECNLDYLKIEQIQKGILNNQTISNIKTLDLSGNRKIDEKSWVLISQDLLKFMNKSLETLNLSDCELINQTFKLLADGIITNNIKTLKNLDLSKNWALIEAGLSDLFTLLILNKDFQIQSLNLSACNINDNKIKTIADTFNNLAINKPSLISLDLSSNKTITENGWKSFGLKILRNLGNLRNLNLFHCDLDCDSKITSCFTILFEKGGLINNNSSPLESLHFSIEAQNLLEGIIILQQSVHQGKVKTLKPKFQNEELLLKMFWSPLDFLVILNKFYNKPKIDAKRIRAKKPKNSKNDLENIKNYGKTVIFEPKTFFPYVFKNPLMNRYEDIILNEGLSIYLQENRLKSSLNQIILINYDHTANDSLLSKNEILRLSELFEATNLDSIYLDYTYNYSRFNLNEGEMLNFMRFLPPKAFIFKEDELSIALKQQQKKSISALKKSRKESLFNNVRHRTSSIINKDKRNNQKITLNGLKALFAILYQNYNISEIKIDYDYDSMLNQGIAFSLREKLYQSFPRWHIFKAFKYIGYKILSLFVVSAKHFKFSSDIIALNSYLDSMKLLYILLLTFIGIFYFISIFLPFFFIEPCGYGLAWASHYIFTAFVVISLFFESILFALIYPKLRPVYLSFLNYASANRKTWKSKLKRRTAIFAYMALSQVAHYDLYSKFSFIRITFECQQHSLGIVAAIFMGIHMFIWIYNYIHMIIHEVFHKSKRELNFQHINKFLHGAHFSEFAAFHDALDVVAPYNVIQIPDIWIIKKIAPNLAGLSINSKLYFFFLKFLLKNTPIIIVQIMFLFFRRDHFGESDSIVTVALVLSLLMFLVDFYKFMSVRPSTIYQGDFDELVRRNKRKRNTWIKEKVEERDRILDN